MLVLLLLFVVAPVADLVLLVRLGREIGLLPVLGLVLATATLGISVLRAEGGRMRAQLERALAGGRPGRDPVDGMAVLAGGALLIAPGLLTDAIGLALIFSPTRRLIRHLSRRWLDRQMESGALQVSVLRWQPGGVPVPDETPEGLDPSKEIRLPQPDPER